MNLIMFIKNSNIKIIFALKKKNLIRKITIIPSIIAAIINSDFGNFLFIKSGF